jgi:amino acid transporter
LYAADPSPPAFPRLPPYHHHYKILHLGDKMVFDVALFLIAFLAFLLPANAFPMIEGRKAAKAISKIGKKKKKFPIGAIVAIIVVVVIIIIIALVVLWFIKKRKAKKNMPEAEPSLGAHTGYQQANY